MSTELSLTFALTYATQATILVAGVVDDLRSRKFHNWLFLACCSLALLAVLITQGWSGVYLSVFGFGAGIALVLPFVLMGMIGAGDMKLMAAFGIIAGAETVFSVAVMSLMWGALFGIVKIALSGQLKILATNMVSIVTLKKRENLELHTIPFAVALFFGWLSHLVYQGIV
jgi:prepilin peptidase CpaA